MNDTMPAPVSIFMEATNSGNTDQLGPFLAQGAILRDTPENREITGAEAIKKLLRESKKQYALSVTVTHVNCTADRVVLTALANGNFAGSPLTFSYNFTLRDSIIHHLAIDLA